MKNQPERPLGKRILLVEDECAMRESLRELLCHDDHTVIEANNGAEALTLFVQDRFDIVLTDSVMPFIRGGELAARIRHLAPDQPILMITGHEMKPGRLNPVNRVLRKPFGLGELRSAISALV